MSFAPDNTLIMANDHCRTAYYTCSIEIWVSLITMPSYLVIDYEIIQFIAQVYIDGADDYTIVMTRFSNMAIDNLLVVTI